MFNNSLLWDRPVQELKSKCNFVCEMSENEQYFLCGLIQYQKPKKIVELGVAEGGTTAVIYESLALLGNKCEMYSVDISEELYYDKSKETGYEYKRMIPYLDKSKEITHQFLFGKTIGGQIDKIGKNIDLVILDTTHQVPGELLDFLCILPYLSEEAIVILHDINLNHIRALSGNRKQVLLSDKFIATKLLFAAVSGRKFLPSDSGRLFSIAGFKVCKDTIKSAENLFCLLTLNWNYIPDDHFLKEYRDILERHYDETYLNLYDNALENNRKINTRIELAKLLNDGDFDKVKHYFPYSQLFHGCKIVLYGAGAVGKEFYDLQKKTNCYEIVAWVDQKYKEYETEKVIIQDPNCISNYDFDFILVAVESKYVFEEIKENIVLNKWADERLIIGPIPTY